MSAILQKYKKESETSYALGATLNLELIQHRKDQILEILYHEKTSLEILDLFQSLAEKHHISLRKNSKAFHILSDKENCFIIGVFNKYSMHLEKNAPHLCLVNPSNSGNLGTIIRSAIGFGIKNISIIRPAVDFFDPKTIRSSMGAIFQANLQAFDSFEEYQSLYPLYQYYPFMLNGKSDLREVKFPHFKATCLIFGNEQTGLPHNFDNLGNSIKINHSKCIDSLNLAQAVNIALYQFTKEVIF